MAERDAPAFKDRAASKEAAMLQQKQQLEGMSQGRREDPRKLQIAESMAKEAEEKQAQEETFRRRAVFFNGPRTIRFAMRPRYGKKSVLYKRRWVYIAGMMSFEPLSTIFGRKFP